MAILSVDPSTGETIKELEPISEKQALVAVDTADEAYRIWRSTTFEERKRVILKFANSLRDRETELAELITQEMGKRISESREEIKFCAQIATFYAENAETFLADKAMDIEGAEAYIHYEPIGVLLGVMPWNFPFYQVVRFATPNLMAGNVTLVRHASNVPQCAQAIEKLFVDAGLPNGVFTNLLIPTELVESVIEHKKVRGVSLTGSERAGASVAAIAGKNIKPTVLELGGNDPFIVLEDADIESAVELAIKGRMMNTGQSCVASKRFIVVEEIADAFIQGFTKAMSQLKMGNPMDSDTEVGPLSTEDAAEDLQQKVEETVRSGAKILLGGDRPDRKGAYFNPTILTDITPEMPSYDQELFGPVASIYKVKDEAAAIELANDSSFGLGGSVYTRDLERGKRVAEAIETGMVFINQPTNSQAELPFGGVKNSGYGRELSELGILEFVNKKLIHVQTKS